MRNKSTIFFLFMVLLAGIVFAFRASDSETQHQARQWKLLTRTLNLSPGNETDTGGRAVSLDSARYCIDKFESEMAKHGFSNKAGEKVDIHIKRTSMITTGELFRGKNLLEWLTNTAAQYDAADKTLMVKIQLGIYDSTYLNTYHSNTALKNRYNNRVAIFLIPYDSAQPNQPLHAMAVSPNGGGGSGGGGGFDLGGLQP